MQAQDTQYKCFSPEVYENLPRELKSICDLVGDPLRKDIFLIGCMTALSAAFSRFRFFSGTGSEKAEYSPHLFSLIIGPAGSGKSMSRYGPLLCHELDLKAAEMNRNAAALYALQKSAYDSKVPGAECPALPPRIGFRVSITDSTMAGLCGFLRDNEQGGFAFDSELDGLKNSAHGTFGGYSPLLRAAFHHEPASRLRKQAVDSYHLDKPRLSFCISGTPEQLRNLISSPEDGLFSRIAFYLLPPTIEPYKRMIPGPDLVGEAVTRLQAHVFSRAAFRSGIPNVLLTFSERQEDRLEIAMGDKIPVVKTHKEISATWNRLPLICKRLAAVLSAFDSDQTAIPDNYFTAALAMTETFKAHAIGALEILKVNKRKKEFDYEQFKTYRGQGLTIAEVSDKMNLGEATIYRNLGKLSLPR
jgi:hypothetical protein